MLVVDSLVAQVRAFEPDESEHPSDEYDDEPLDPKEQASIQELLLRSFIEGYVLVNTCIEADEDTED